VTPRQTSDYYDSWSISILFLLIDSRYLRMVAIMLLRQLIFAASAASFLVVPDASIASDNDDVVKTLPIEVEGFSPPVTAFSQSIDVPCNKCRGRNTHLKMDFAVEDGARLTLNGFELYPNADPWHGDLSASVVRGSGYEKSQRLGYSLFVEPEGMDPSQQLEVIGVDLRVIEVGNRFIDGIPSIQIKLVKAPTQEILIGSLDIKERAPSGCRSAWCRARERFDKAVKGIGGCRKPSRPTHGFHHGPQRTHHHPHGPQWMADGPAPRHQWGHLIRNMASHIFLPVLMGITAGFGVAIFAMCLCRIIIRLTGLVNSDRQPAFLRCPHRRSARAHQEVARDEEKAALMEEEEPRQDDEPAKN
jgi:hypothetical protein